MLKVGILATHPIQYYVPWYKSLTQESDIDLTVYYCHQQTAKDQADAGFKVSFEWDIPLLEGYQYHFLKNISPNPDVYNFAGCNTPEIGNIIREGHFDAFIVQGWYNKSFWQAILACWHTKTAVFVRGDSQLGTQRSWLKRMIKYPIYRWFIPRFDAYLVVGKRNRDYYLHYGADAKKLFFAPHAVDNAFFVNHKKIYGERKAELRQEFGFPKDAIIYLLAAKLIPKKRPFDFLQALHNAQESNNSIYGLIVGDGPLREELETFSKFHNIQVKFAGFLNQSEIPKAFALSDVLVVTSDQRETWGLVINEALASGLPAIVSDQVGAVPDLIIEGKTGSIYECGNLIELQNLLIDYAINPKQLEQLNVGGDQHIHNYSIKILTENTMIALKSVGA